MATNLQAHPHAPISLCRFTGFYVTTMRPYLMFVSGITGITALAFIPEVAPGKALMIALASFLSYGFGQALTDCFQTDTDSLSAPYRPLTQGSVSRNQVLAVSAVGLTGCILVFACCHPVNLLLGLIGGIGLATYTPFKRRWWGGPFYNAWIVALLFVMAFLAGTGPEVNLRPSGFFLCAGIVFFGYANFVLSGYFKDIDADRLTGYNTLPVVFGRKRSSFMSDAFAASTLLLLIPILLRHSVASLGSMVFISAGISALFAAQLLLHRVKSDATAHMAIVPGLHSYMLLLSGISLLQKTGWGVWLALFYAGFVLAMLCRPEKQQI